MSLIPFGFGTRRSGIFDPFSLDAWDPFKDSLFPLSSQLPQETSSFVNARIDWKETPEAHVFKADLPGLKKEEVKVEVEGDRVLQIRGERKVEKEDKSDTWHRVERSSGTFQRSFRLPENVKMDDIKASMENGVLTVTVPKVEADLPGLKKEEVKVEVEDDRVLQIRGERKVEEEDKSDTWHRVERSSGTFERRFKLPENVKLDEIKASMEDGVLTVSIPKVEVKKRADVKTIEISG
ncbi:HSP20 domain-containing protein [Cephalotus follicularis]|uniref:HSP20 domain-containing protein n=1 Tax=Cephalotus follicularis TaxID=3775 RepID=A0A1Q3C2R5_CEPFO|nr:HSP20 domain-containing protein [Cephalotus follicularis]